MVTKNMKQGGRSRRLLEETQRHNMTVMMSLVKKGKKVSSPQLTVLHGIGGDGVWATKVKPKERCHECEDGVVAIVVHVVA
ncbi:hypothetical protein HPP92_027647 [Vanilla planifolia]|uniref:Uncharacterized protein n=1 Tax=Vanilla planifolia TaxID=51239 RepID=A0A835PB06_VANPL|nr:hypothetical protein HPP92_027647 [Vanilla planifolia]